MSEATLRVRVAGGRPRLRALALAMLGYSGNIQVSAGDSMQKIDPSFLYHTGAAIRPLARISTDSDWLEAYGLIAAAVDAVSGMVDHSIYSPSLRQTHERGQSLASFLQALTEKMLASTDWQTRFTGDEINILQSLFWNFESALLVELQNASIYYVQPKGGFDMESLINLGEELFPHSLGSKIPSAIADVREGARSLAFQLWTGAGFHFHRANESVLRAYMDHVAPSMRKPKMTMGGMVHKMRELKVGDAAVLSALSNLINFHRNPLAHPEHSIETQDEAISLYATIRAAMGYMLDDLPDPPIAAPPPLVRMNP
jgi:hypothetical protein